jgi:two-component sensor histidine kinase/ActR/RegA family two-component response regulator
MPTRQISILYIDDDPGIARLVQRVLSRRGYEVETASNAEDGLKRLAAGGIDVVGLDHFLPTGTGLDLLRELQSWPAAPQVVYVTGSGETSVAVAALKAGAADYVPKAVGEEFLELLGSAVDQAVEKARLQRARDRAEREVREARDRAEMLLHEVNHRVANSLALVAGLVRMQANTIGDRAAVDVLNQVQARITAIAGVHRRLYTSDDVRSVELKGYLEGLLTEFGTTLTAGGTAQFVLDAESISVPTDKAVSIGVVVTELVTNAVKYAYPDGRNGEIRVSLRRIDQDKLRLTVEDDGVGCPDGAPARGTGVGSRIVTAMARGLGSAVEYRTPPGCRVTLEIEA